MVTHCVADSAGRIIFSVNEYTMVDIGNHPVYNKEKATRSG